MNIITASRQYGMISHDITNHCNARCKFCFNDWDKMQPCVMSLHIFNKARTIIPFTMPGMFLLSCLFEPTLHPDFFSLLYKIPYQFKDKVIFTTNLVKKLTDDELIALCNSPVKYFNISLETYIEDKYYTLSGTRNSAFYDNLSRLSKFAKELGKQSKIRIITMLMRSNMDEIVSIIKKVREEISPLAHEIRTPYISSPIEGVLRDELLSKNELYAVSGRIKNLGYKEVILDLGRNEEVLYDYLEMKKKYSEKSLESDNKAYRVKIKEGVEVFESSGLTKQINNFTYQVRINSDGTGYFVDTDEIFDLSIITDMEMFWSDNLWKLQKKEIDQYIYEGDELYDVTVYGEECISGELSDLIIFDEQFITLCGYYQDNKGFWKGCERVVLLVQAERGGVLLHTMGSSIDNVKEVVFSTKFARSMLDDTLKIDVYVGYKNKTGLHMRKISQLNSMAHILNEVKYDS